MESEVKKTVRQTLIAMASVFIIFAAAGCGVTVPDPARGEQRSEPSGNPIDSNPAATESARADDDEWKIRVIDAAGEELWSFTETEVKRLSQQQAAALSFVYSTINNWPAERLYAAGGYSVTDILQAAGVYETAQTITFRAADGYEASLTREQLFSSRYYFPHVGEDAEGAALVLPIIAYRWREGSGDISEIRDDKPLFIFGQQDPFEHTNPAFVAGVTEIIVNSAPCEAWPPASTFPMPGQIEAGETVKLQHQYFGLVKLYYTIDGSDPTVLSTLYNPSTYQPELNRPIPITQPVTIKALAAGYGRNDSEIAVFEFIPVS